MDYSTIKHAGDLPYTGIDLVTPMIGLVIILFWAALIAWWAE